MDYFLERRKTGWGTRPSFAMVCLHWPRTSLRRVRDAGVSRKDRLSGRIYAGHLKDGFKRRVVEQKAPLKPDERDRDYKILDPAHES